MSARAPSDLLQKAGHSHWVTEMGKNGRDHDALAAPATKWGASDMWSRAGFIVTVAIVIAWVITWGLLARV